MTKTYSVSKANRHATRGSLVDRGANGGLAGSDMVVISTDTSGRTINVSGIDGHQLSNLEIVTAGGYMNSDKGPIIGIFHQYAHIKTGNSIHSSGQLEHFQVDVNDRSLRVGGLQRISTPDGYSFPLDIIEGLAYLQIRPYTKDEFEDPQIPHVIMTSDIPWDPSILDCTISDDTRWHAAINDLERKWASHSFDEHGNYKQRHGQTRNDFPGTSLLSVNVATYHANLLSLKHVSRPVDPDFDALRKFFLWKDAVNIQTTYQNTTQYARRRPQLGPTIRDTYHSPFPMFNVHRRHEPVATDTVFCSTPAVGGFTCAQIFVGRHSHVIDIFGMKTPGDFHGTLQDVIRKRGAMDKLISDRAQVEISKAVVQTLRALVIADWQSEPHYQHQNYAERQWQELKRLTHVVLDRSNAPAKFWLLCLHYVAFILNRMSVPSLRDRAPLTVLTGQIPDISMIPVFGFYEEVYFLHYSSTSDPLDKSRECLGHFVGFAETVGHDLTFKVFNPSTEQTLYRSRLRLAQEGERNLRADADAATAAPTTASTPTLEQNPTSTPTAPVLTSSYDLKLADGRLLPTIDPEDLIGRSFNLPPVAPNSNSPAQRATILELVNQYEQDLHSNPDHVKFRCKVGNDVYKDLISYNQILEYLEEETVDDKSLTHIFKFTRIAGHQGPLKKGMPGYKGSSYNLLIEWEGHEPSYEPLHHMVKEDPTSCIAYAKANNLLDLKGFGRVKRLARLADALERQANATNIRSSRFSPVYMYGIRVPRNHKEAMMLDKENKNTLWADAEHAELSSIQSFQAFKDRGHRDNAKIPKGYKKITVHMVYAVKHDGRHKARLVAGGHLTDTPVESVYSSVVSLKGVRMTIFTAELNNLEIWSTDIGNAYLESYTQEKVYVIAGPEFAPFGLEGHVLLIDRALYGLKSSGLRWWERLADVLREMGFFPSRAETDIWMRRVGDHYEYICVYVDDIIVCSLRPRDITDALETKYKFSLKGTGPIHFHLGCDYFRDPDGTLCYGPRRYIDKMVADFERMFQAKPKKYSSPLEKGDHPETDDSEILDLEGIKQFQSLIGSIQWAVQLGRLDVTTAVMSLSSFRAAPRKGHLDRAKRVIGYLVQMQKAFIRVRTDAPDFSGIPDTRQKWDQSIYKGAREIIPDDIPEPLGRPVVCTSYVDANLYHDLTTGRSVTGTLHFFNRTPIDWYSKKQSTVETATYGSEFVAARTATEQIIANRTALRYLGIRVTGPTYLFGDNHSVVDSATVPQSKLNKRHVALSFHRVREAIAAKVLRFEWIASGENPADILSKHWGYQQVGDLIQALLFMPNKPLPSKGE